MCTILIVINNDGKSAYKNEVYGPFIKVERMFSQSTGSYKIKNSDGKLSFVSMFLELQVVRYPP